MIKKTLPLLFTILASLSLLSQEYNIYQPPIDTSFVTVHLGYEKELSVLLPDDWQHDIQKKAYPLIVVFDRQNQRSHQHILRTIDYLTAAEQMPRCVVISVASDNMKRISEAKSPVSGSNGRADLNERFLFDEVIQLAESNYHASPFRILVGHSWYGHFVTSMFAGKHEELGGVIALDPFFSQTNVSLIDSIAALQEIEMEHTRYFRYSIGKDYPEDLRAIQALQKEMDNPKIDIHGTHFPHAFHNAIPGLGIGEALYEIFEYWSVQQYAFFQPSNQRVDVFAELNQNLIDHYGSSMDFSLGVLNGKGWGFYNEGEYDKAIAVWNELIHQYPNFSEAYLYIIDAQEQLGQDTSATQVQFQESLKRSEFYSEEEKRELLAE